MGDIMTALQDVWQLSPLPPIFPAGFFLWECPPDKRGVFPRVVATPVGFVRELTTNKGRYYIGAVDLHICDRTSELAWAEEAQVQAVFNEDTPYTPPNGRITYVILKDSRQLDEENYYRVISSSEIHIAV